MPLDWGSSYSCEWRIYKVNTDTWLEGEEVTNFVNDITLSKDSTDSVPLLESGSMSMDGRFEDELTDGYYRIVVHAHQSPYHERHPLATLLFEKSSDEISEYIDVTTMDGRSVLKPAADITCLAGTYAPKGVDGAEWVRNLLSECISAPIEINGTGFTLDDPISFSGGTSYLSMCWSVLDTAKWCMQIDGDGIVTILKIPEESELLLANNARHFMQPKLTRDRDLLDIPNRYIAVFGDNVEVAENHNRDSSVSYESRGRWVDYYDSSPKRVNGETAYAYSRRRLEEESTRVVKWTYDREYLPEVVPFDLMEASIPEYGFDGQLRVLSQKYKLDKGIVVSETCGVEYKEFIA